MRGSLKRTQHGACNIIQRCCAQHVASLEHPVARCCMKFEPNQTSCNIMQLHATCCAQQCWMMLHATHCVRSNEPLGWGGTGIQQWSRMCRMWIKYFFDYALWCFIPEFFVIKKPTSDLSRYNRPQRLPRINRSWRHPLKSTIKCRR